MAEIAELVAPPKTLEATLSYFVDTETMPVTLVGRTLRVPGAAPGAVRRALGDISATVTSAPATLEERFFELTLAADATQAQP